MSDSQENGRYPDIPPDILCLARRIQRDCASPGRYVIEYVVSDYSSQPRQVTISRSEMVRRFEVHRQVDRNGR